MTGDVTSRPARRPQDDQFFLTVYDSTRRPELTRLGWPEAEIDGFILMQFEAQSRHYATAFPDADHRLVLAGGRPAGRLIVDRPGTELLIVDIALLPAFRGMGAAGTLVRALGREADAARLPVRCHVALGNQAHGFWVHMGFQDRRIEGGHVAMERPGSAATP